MTSKRNRHLPFPRKPRSRAGRKSNWTTWQFLTWVLDQPDRVALAQTPKDRGK